MPAVGKFTLAIEIIPRVLGAATASGEQPPSWPDPPAGGTRPYMAAPESIGGGELITLGQFAATQNMRVRVKGWTFAVAVEDLVKSVVPGDLHRVVGISRDYANGETVLTLERFQHQSTPQ